VRAGFSDPQGRKLWRVLPYALTSFALLFAIFGPLHGRPAEVLGFGSYAVLHLLGALRFRQRKPRNAELECGPGYVAVKNVGSRSQRIAAKDIIGATTARTPSGYLLTLQHKRRTTPITLELANEAEVEKVRHALGIGHGGFGELSWRTEGDSTTRSAFIGNVVGALSGLILAAQIAAGEGGGWSVLFGMAGFVATIMALVGMLSPASQPSIVMTAHGIRLRTTRGWFALPYEALRDITENPTQLVFSVPAPYNSVVVEKSRPITGGLSEADRNVVTAQLMAAAQRARGMGPQKNDVTGRVDVLRRNGESPRDWLVRLDMAGQMLAAGSGYRGNTLDKEDLWAILEDPEAEPELRAAAARVLRHAPETKVRIDAAVAAVRDETTTRRLRIAVSDDLDGATEDLAVLDAEDWRAPRMRMHP
jgi:hypothetical protein